MNEQSVKQIGDEEKTNLDSGAALCTRSVLYFLTVKQFMEAL